ncbi:hypothetical protein GQ53DRAFT_847848 [Thozetella sp. PMI_491]|nr:hypothetical protein GQ53DRAFT_847848 [Thozetella sp. PMI_491]
MSLDQGKDENRDGGQRLDPSIVPPIPQVSDPWTVDKALASLSEAKPPQNSRSPLPYFHLMERLKTTKRAGWKRFGISQGESLSDHMYRMALMSMCAPESLRGRLDLSKCMTMCLVHDMAESLVGDLTPLDGVPKPEKSRREAGTMEYITKELMNGFTENGEAIRAAWLEFEEAETLDSRYVQDLDKIELLAQMMEYERRGKGEIDLSEFTYVATKVMLPEMKAWADEILAERKEFWDRVSGAAEKTTDVSSEHKELLDQYYDH